MKNYKVLFIFIFSLYFINCETTENKPNDFLASATLNPVPGEYTNPLSVELSTTITGATIRYTLDSSTIPSSTIGTIYTSPIWLTQSTTIKHIVYKDGKSSKVISSTYTLKSSSSLANAVVPFTITSSDFTNGGALPTEFGGNGDKNFPSLNWSTSIPSGTKSFVLLVIDENSTFTPSGQVLLNWSSIPLATTSISKIWNTNSAAPENCLIGKPNCVSFPIGILGGNFFGFKEWEGPRLTNSGTHNINFTIYALSSNPLDLSNIIAQDLLNFETSHSEHILGKATIKGRYTKP